MHVRLLTIEAVRALSETMLKPRRRFQKYSGPLRTLMSVTQQTLNSRSAMSAQDFAKCLICVPSLTTWIIFVANAAAKRDSNLAPRSS